jgi:hypothetical protein
MRQGKLGGILLAGIISFFILTGVASAEDFSADIVNTAGGMSFQGKIFVSKEKTRMEMPGAITIARMDKKIAWVLMPAQQMYMEQPINPATMATSEKVSGEIERKLIGSDIIEGRKADKYRVVYTDDSGKKWVMLQWFMSGLNIPVKSASEDASWSMEYKNIKRGAQPDALFEVPAGYKKFSYGIGALKDMLQ